MGNLTVVDETAVVDEIAAIISSAIQKSNVKLECYRAMGNLHKK